MSGFTGLPTAPVTLSFDPNGNYQYGPAPTTLGTLSDPLGGGVFNAATSTFTAVASVVGTPSPASQILDRLVYTPPPTANGLAPSITASVNVTSLNPATRQVVASSAASETLQIVTPPSITGTIANQPVASGGLIDPFGVAQVVDGGYGSNPALNETITVTDGGAATDADGLLTGSGLSKTGVGTYTLSGYNSYNLSSLVFTTSAGAGTRVASFALAANDTASGYTTTDSTTSVQIIGVPTTGGGGGGGSGIPVILGAGNQTYSAKSGDTVLAGSGNDTVVAAAGQVSVIASAGMLSFIGGTAASSVTGGAGSNTILGGSGGGYYTGGRAGFNVLISQGASGANTTLTGAGAGDQIYGSAAGNDVLIAGSGRDSILGGGGHTTIQGGAAASVIFTGGGVSTVNGSTSGADTIVGGAGGLNVNAQMGDAIFGGGGALTVTGSKTGADSIVGGAGALTVNGQGGNMLVVAGTGTSTIQVGNGASLVFASGSTSVTGGAGSLQVVLGAGSANVTEGSGPAVFDVVKGSAGGADVLNGFRPGTDQIQLYGFAAADRTLSVVGGSTIIALADGTKIQVVGVTSLGGSLVG